jgi:hypothetical protein
MHDTAYLCNNLLKEGSKLPDRDQYSVTRKIFGTERFSRQTTVHAFLTYTFSYALNKQFWKKRPRSTKQLAAIDW